MLAVRTAIPQTNPLAKAEFATIRERLIKIAARVIEQRKAGVYRVLLEARDRGRDEVLRVLDRNAPLVSVLT